MANIKSSKKRILIAERNNERNVAFKSAIKTAIKKALELANKGEALDSALAKVYQLCDKAVGKGIMHKNTAARKKSRLTIAMNKIAEKLALAPTVEQVAEAKAEKVAIKKATAKKATVKKTPAKKA